MSSDAPWLPLDDLVEDIIDRRGVTPLKLGGLFTSSGHRVISAKLLKGGRIDLGADEPRYVNSAVYAKWMKGPLLPGDVLMTSEAPLGELAYINANLDWCLGQRLFAIRPKKDRLDGCFAYYALQTRQVREDLIGRSTGTTVQGIRQSELRRVRLPVPDLSLQVAAASVLKAIDDRTALLRETNATLEAIAQALFKSWFVDFDPVRAKQRGSVPVGNDEATAALFPADLYDSALGLIPSGWEVKQIAEVVEAVFDGPHATPAESVDGPVFLGIKNLTGTTLDLSEIRHIAEADFAQWTKRVTPRACDIVFSYEATLGFFALIPPGLRCCLGRRLALIRPKPDQKDGHFWFHQFVAAPFQRLLAQHTIQGATVNRIALKHFPSYSVICPPTALRAAFDACVAPLWSRIHANQAQAQTLTRLRDTLLPRLISGQLRLPDAAVQITEACA
jgi:type I restriction enzyme S subunit